MYAINADARECKGIRLVLIGSQRSLEDCEGKARLPQALRRDTRAESVVRSNSWMRRRSASRFGAVVTSTMLSLADERWR